MAHVTGDRVKDTTTTTGTGNITVSGSAPTGFRTLSTVATADGDTLFLAIVGGSEWEVCLATRVSANVYARTTVLASSNSGSAVNFSAGTKDVFVTLPASKIADNTAYASSWDGDTATAPSKNAVYDKFEAFLGPARPSANWFMLNGGGSPLGAGSAFTANRIYYIPFVVTQRITLTDLGGVVSTGVSGNVAFAIYASSAGIPSGTPLANTGNVSCTSAAAVSGDISGVASVTLDPGLYWAAFWSDVACALVAASITSGVVLSSVIGSATLSNVLSTSGQGMAGRFADETYNASAWPNATTEAPAEMTVANRNYILLGKAA